MGSYIQRQEYDAIVMRLFHSTHDHVVAISGLI